MFRTVEISCTVESRGPRASNATAWVLISRPGDAAALVKQMETENVKWKKVIAAAKLEPQ